MLIDCDNCEVRDLACDDCVVTMMLGAPASGLEIDDGERRALDALAEVGMVPPLRLALADGVLPDEVIPYEVVPDEELPDERAS